MENKLFWLFVGLFLILVIVSTIDAVLTIGHWIGHP